ncbi:MAG: hypothetical protein AABX38_04535 [Candidatus Micrarchaeota archaeon]
MENVTLNVIYNEIKKLEKMVYVIDQKVENYRGLEILNQEEMKKLKQISKEMKTSSKSIKEFSKEMGVEL